MIEINNVTFTYGETSLNKDNSTQASSLNDIDLKINNGEFVLLLGASGCGKTSITRLINGLIPEFYQGELKGDIIVEGKNTKQFYVSQLSDDVGSVFQDPHSQFFTSDTTSEIVFSCENAGMPREEIKANLEKITDKLQINHLLDKSVFQLSGGEKQMVAIASVCAYSPKIIVFDEPSANLDSYAIGKLKKALETLKKEGYTIVISEHRIHYLTKLCDRVLIIENGKIIKEITNNEFSLLNNNSAHNLGLRAIDLKSLDIKENQHINKDISLKINNICYYYDKQTNVINNLSAQFNKGDIVGIIGKNGVGKTTFLEVLCGLRKEKCGDILINGIKKKVKQRNKETYLVMQNSDYQLFTDSVENEIYLGVKKENQSKKCNYLIEKMNLQGLNERHPASLSGGQKQRLCVAVAYMKNASIVCFDEPTSGLDYKSMLGVTEILKELSNEGKTIFVITHDYEFLVNSCNKVFYFENNNTTKIMPVNTGTKDILGTILGEVKDIF